MSYAMGQRVGLSRTRARDDQERRHFIERGTAVFGRAALLSVEIVEVASRHVLAPRLAGCPCPICRRTLCRARFVLIRPMPVQSMNAAPCRRAAGPGARLRASKARATRSVPKSLSV